MQKVNRGAKDVHLTTHSCDLIAYPWEEVPNGTEPLCAVFDVPDLIVKVPKDMNIKSSFIRMYK